MIDPEEFAREVDKKFWTHITRNSAFLDPISFEDIDKDSYLKRVASELRRHSYHFSLPVYLYFPKENGVLRRLKSFNLSDTAVFYYCVKSLQSELVQHISKTPFIFGGFRFTPDLKLSEEKLDAMHFDAEYQGFAKNSFRKYWNEYTKVASKLNDKNYSNYIHIDIAHFYDDVNLDLLEKSVRNVVQGKEAIIDLLFHFLRNSDRKDLGYTTTSVGLPQEEVSEMSRLLANFYLSSFDERIRGEVTRGTGLKNGSDFFYTRYADDMWIAINADNNTCMRVIQIFSSELLRLKLHISEKKLKIYSPAEYQAYWRFDGWDSLQEKKKDPKEVLGLIQALARKPEGRWYSIFLYGLKVVTSNAHNAKLFNTYRKADKFLDLILAHPRVLLQFEKKSETFFSALFTKHGRLQTKLINYVQSGGNLYPSIEYKVLQLLSNCCGFDETIYAFFLNIVYKDIHRDYQWYSRTIALGFITRNLQLIEDADPAGLTKLFKHLGNSQGSRTESKERRSAIKLLMSARDHRGSKALSNYTTPEDIALQKYIRGDNDGA